MQCESTNKTSKPTPSRMLPMRCLKKWILEYLIKNVGTKSAKFFFQEEILIWYYLKWCSFSIANLKLIKYIHPEKSNSSYKTFVLYIYSFWLKIFVDWNFASFIDDKFLESAIYDGKQDVSNRQCYTIIKTQARPQRAEGKWDTVNRVRFLYICRALGHLS